MTTLRLEIKKTKNVRTNISLIVFCLIQEWSLMIHDPPPTTPYISAHCPPCVPAVQWLTLDSVSHTKPGLRFNEPSPQGEKNNYLFRHQGEESLTPPHLFHVCVYSCFFLCFFCTIFPEPLYLSLHGRGHKQWVTPQAGGQMSEPNYVSVFHVSLPLSSFF